jgi:dTDP-4-dehydrorhamnose reductase
MKKILITGASGLLGVNLGLTAHSCGYKVTGITLEEGIQATPFDMHLLDLTKPEMIHKAIKNIHPDVIINCVALTNVDHCEQVPDDARRINTEIPEALARVSSRCGIKLVQISTDAVFDGKRGNYTEMDPVSPLNVYASTKFAGEVAVQERDKTALVCRVNFYGWSISGRRSLGEWFFNKMSHGEPVKGFTDAIFSPLLATDLAEIILKLVELDKCGLFHVVNPQSISKYDFGLILAKQFGFNRSLITPASILDAGLAAVRSPKLNLNAGKVIQVLGMDFPDQQTEMLRFHKQYLDGYPQRLKLFSNANI